MSPEAKFYVRMWAAGVAFLGFLMAAHKFHDQGTAKNVLLLSMMAIVIALVPHRFIVGQIRTLLGLGSLPGRDKSVSKKDSSS